jgi:hypothetical protein
MHFRDLTNEGDRWIEACARRLRSHEHSLTYMAAIELAFDLHCAWPGVGPEDAALAVGAHSSAAPVASPA